ncbi:MAG: hypothetical protein N2255_09020 [Kiritimatiellae bacterium]|nr:hypothetical protein [Kiritimatiellia bacterium]
MPRRATGHLPKPWSLVHNKFMRRSGLPIVPVEIVALLLAGCVSTPAQRIACNPELFASFPPEVQEQIRKGQIAIGFDRDMVRIALGQPDRVYERRTETGIVEVWSYLWPCFWYDTQLVPVESYWIDRSGHLRIHQDWVWLRAGHSCQEERLRVEFENGRVIAVETLRRP